MARLFEELGREAEQIEERVEGELRAVRNSLAHGADHRRGLDIFAAEAFLGDVLRAAIGVLLAMAASQEPSTDDEDHSDQEEPALPQTPDNPAAEIVRRCADWRLAFA